MTTELQAAQLTELDIAVGFPLGGRPVDLPETSSTPRQVLEAIIRAALERPPCVVTFSGGRDSSAILALAIHVARRDGLPDPVAVTRVHPCVASTDEAKWQELVVRHLGVRDWQRLELYDELDLLGAYGRRVLNRFGTTWPPMLHTSLLPLEIARGGSLLTGEGGDEILGGRRSTVLERLRTRKQRPGRQAIKSLLAALGPRPVRRRLLHAAVVDARRTAWLREGVVEEATRGLLAARLDEPIGWLASSRWELGQRKRLEGARTYAVLGSEMDVAITHPLLDPEFVSALRVPAGRFGFCCRGCAMAEVFGDLLPPQILYRRSKAEFALTLFRAETREFISSWAGPHPLEHLVDSDRLRHELAKERPHAGVVLLLQQAWLADQPERRCGPKQ